MLHRFRYGPARPLGAAILIACWFLLTGMQSGAVPLALPGWLFEVAGVAGAFLVLWGRIQQRQDTQDQRIKALEAGKADVRVLEEIDRRLTGHHDAVADRIGELREDMKESLTDIRAILHRIQDKP